MGCAPPPGFFAGVLPATSDCGGGGPPPCPAARGRRGVRRRPPGGDRRSARGAHCWVSRGSCCPALHRVLRSPGGDRLQDRQPPNATRPPFVPGAGTPTLRVPDGPGGARSARGYPAAVSTPVGADPAVVGPYLASVLEDERWRSVSIGLIAAGMSNLTYTVTPDGGSAADAVILRRPPTGAVLATAHDIVREHTGLSALWATPVPVPRTLHLCTDASVLGAPFYLMERVSGLHVTTAFPPGYAD